MEPCKDKLKKHCENKRCPFYIGVRPCDKEADKIEATLHFIREQLLYDVANLGYVEGDVMTEDAPHPRHQTQDIIQEGSVDRVTRVLDLAHADCVEALYNYTKRDVEESDMDDTLSEPEEYVIRLFLPKDFSQTTLNLIAKSVHEYLVACVMADWLSITNPPASAKWTERSKLLLDAIKNKMNHRNSITRRRMSPF